MTFTVTYIQLLFLFIGIGELALFAYFLIQCIRKWNKPTLYPHGLVFIIGGMVATFTLYGGIYLW